MAELLSGSFQVLWLVAHTRRDTLIEKPGSEKQSLIAETLLN